MNLILQEPYLLKELGLFHTLVTSSLVASALITTTQLEAIGITCNEREVNC
jgi:hypothetical protein